MSSPRRLLRPRRAATAALVGLAVLAVLGGSAGAERSVIVPFSVDRVDASGHDLAIDVTRTGQLDRDALDVSVGGRRVANTSVVPLRSVAPVDVAIVIDNSSTIGNGPVQLAKEAAGVFTPGRSADRASVFTTADALRSSVSSTSSPAAFKSGLATVSASDNPSTLWSAADRAVAELAGSGDVQRNLVMVVGAKDDSSEGALARLDTSLRHAGVRLHVVALAAGAAPLDELGGLVDSHGGTIQAGTSDELVKMLDKVGATIDATYRITTPAPAVAEGQLGSVELTWGAEHVAAAYPDGRVTTGWALLGPPTVAASAIDDALSSDWAKWLIVVFGMAAVSMAVYATISLVTRSREGIDFALRHYDGSVTEVAPLEKRGQTFARGEILKRAVAVTGRLAERRGTLVRVEDALERADIPLRPAEAIFFYLAAAIVAVLVSLAASGNPLISLGVAILAVLLPNFVVKFRAKRRRKKFVGQLPDMLQLLSGTLRAGYSVSQGFEAVSNEIQNPMGRELRRVMTEARLGRPLEDALDAAAERMNSEDFGWAVMAIRIQREVGGNLSELLMTVSETMVQRERLRRDVAALTAEGRISAIVLGLLPPGLAGVMFVMNPTYIGTLFKSGMGIAMIIAAVISMLIGFAWMKKVITIEI